MAGDVGSCSVAELPDYQLGTINLLDKPASSGSFTKKFVYDGQQRIVTLCLLLAALRERLEAAAQGEDGLDEKGRELCMKLVKSLAQKVHQVGGNCQGNLTAAACTTETGGSANGASSASASSAADSDIGTAQKLAAML